MNRDDFVAALRGERELLTQAVTAIDRLLAIYESKTPAEIPKVDGGRQYTEPKPDGFAKPRPDTECQSVTVISEPGETIINKDAEANPVEEEPVAPWQCDDSATAMPAPPQPDPEPEPEPQYRTGPWSDDEIITARRMLDDGAGGGDIARALGRHVGPTNILLSRLRKEAETPERGSEPAETGEQDGGGTEEAAPEMAEAPAGGSERPQRDAPASVETPEPRTGETWTDAEDATLERIVRDGGTAADAAVALPNRTKGAAQGRFYTIKREVAASTPPPLSRDARKVSLAPMPEFKRTAAE